MKVSVAMAAYNGEKFIEKQIASILSQLGKEDELVISCNPSKDSTWEIISRLSGSDQRIKPVLFEKKGVLKNFENAISLCSGDIIFLSDQDDIWVEGKVKRIVSLFDKYKDVGGIVHGYRNIDERDLLLPEQPAAKKTRRIRLFEIIVKNPVQGSCLAFRREIVKYVLPLPEKIPMHDSYIGLGICKYSRLIYIPDPFLLYRSHSETVTTRRHKSVPEMVKDRIWLMRSVLKLSRSR
ncbi:MAG: glycosyltransferase [Lachnospiraceae bacterium]|nr:glycosyltransferase [Lachnospiraceae bacterium]